MNDFLKMKKLQGNCPVMVARIPKPILKEIDGWVKECRKIKNHPLAELKAHENVGYIADDGKKHNSYQCSVPRRLIHEGYWLPWVLKLSAKYWGAGKSHRRFFLRDLSGHYDGYDVWANFANKGDDNPIHNHAGFLSGVIYYRNHDHPTIFDQYGCAYAGVNGTMVMFPSEVLHHVEEQTSSKERITFAFNIQRDDDL